MYYSLQINRSDLELQNHLINELIKHLKHTKMKKKENKI